MWLSMIFSGGESITCPFQPVDSPTGVHGRMGPLSAHMSGVPLAGSWKTRYHVREVIFTPMIMVYNSNKDEDW